MKLLCNQKNYRVLLFHDVLDRDEGYMVELTGTRRLVASLKFAHPSFALYFLCAINIMALPTCAHLNYKARERRRATKDHDSPYLVIAAPLCQPP
jgi:hypothetical protein